MASTRAQLIVLLDLKVLSGNSNTTAQNVRDFENEAIISNLNKTDDLNTNGGYLGIASGRVNIGFINASVPSGQFLRDDGTWQTVSVGASDLESVLAVGNTTGSNNIVVKSGQRIDGQAGLELNLGTVDADTVNIGVSGGEVFILGDYLGQTSITTLGTITAGKLSTGSKIGGTTMELGSDAIGDIYYRDASGVLARLAAGTAGKFLRFAGVSTIPVVSTLVLPNAASAGCILYATSTNTIGESNSLMFLSSTFMVGVTTQFRLQGDAGALGDITAGCRLSSVGDMNIYEAAGTAGKGVLMHYYNGTTFKSGLEFFNVASGTTIMKMFKGGGKVGIALGDAVSPTAILHLAAGTATASSAPLKFNSGTLLTAAEAGAIEFLTDKYYATITTGAARKEIMLRDTTQSLTNFYSTSTTPAIVAGSGAGTTPTISVTGTNSGGKIDLTTGTLPTAGGTIATITFSGGFTLPTGCYPVISPGNSNTALAAIYYVVGNTTNLVISAATGLSLTAATAYVFNYSIIGH